MSDDEGNLAIRRLLQKHDHTSIKFHIQRDLADSVQSWLLDLLEENGGEHTQKIPTQGYVLIDPTTPKGQELQERWGGADNPNRHVVPWPYLTFACYSHRLGPTTDLKGFTPVFKDDDGEVVTFHLQPHLGASRIDALEPKIIKAGGRLVDSGTKARVIIGDNMRPSFKGLVEHYENQDVVQYVETVEWLKVRIATQTYKHSRERGTSKKKRSRDVSSPAAVREPTKKAPRTEYTADEDKHLVAYLGERLPYSNMPGRGGNKIYMELCERPEQYPWSTRHTWQSWRNRYKQDTATFNKKIEKWVSRNPQAVPNLYIIPGRSKKVVPQTQEYISEPDKDSDEDQPTPTRQSRHRDSRNGLSRLEKKPTAIRDWDREGEPSSSRRATPTSDTDDQDNIENMIKSTLLPRKYPRSSSPPQEGDEEEAGDANIAPKRSRRAVDLRSEPRLGIIKLSQKDVEVPPTQPQNSIGKSIKRGPTQTTQTKKPAVLAPLENEPLELKVVPKRARQPSTSSSDDTGTSSSDDGSSKNRKAPKPLVKRPKMGSNGGLPAFDIDLIRDPQETREDQDAFAFGTQDVNLD